MVQAAVRSIRGQCLEQSQLCVANYSALIDCRVQGMSTWLSRQSLRVAQVVGCSASSP